MTQPQPIIPVIRNHTSHVKQPLLTIKKKKLDISEEKHDGFGTLNSKNHRSNPFQARDTREYHITPIKPQHFRARGDIPFKTSGNIYVVTWVSGFDTLKERDSSFFC